MFNKMKKKIKAIQKQIIPLEVYYRQQFAEFKKLFNTQPDKHKIVIKTTDDMHLLEFTDLDEAQRNYKEILEKWNSQIYIDLDGVVVGTSNIVSINFEKGKHTEEYTEEEIDQIVTDKLNNHIRQCYIVKPKHRLAFGFEYTQYDLDA